MQNKTLLLLRHGKSSWKDTQLQDQDRPLNSRGRKAAARMGRLIHDEHLKPELVLCSTARRTRETADLVFAEFTMLPKIAFLDDLYHAEPNIISQILSQVTEPTNCVLLIGHNPGLEEFLLSLTGEDSKFPTAALARINVQLTNWVQFDKSTRGTLTQLWRPRELEAE